MVQQLLQKINNLKKIIYWSPHINPQIATVKAVLNSAKCLSKYEKNSQVNIINVFGEWNDFENICYKNNIKLINLTNFKFNLPINGFLKSRFFYIFISIVSIFKLPLIIFKLKPDYFIAHLIVIPVLFIHLQFKNKIYFKNFRFAKIEFLEKIFGKYCQKIYILLPVQNYLNQLIK